MTITRVRVVRSRVRDPSATPRRLSLRPPSTLRAAFLSRHERLPPPAPDCSRCRAARLPSLQSARPIRIAGAASPRSRCSPRRLPRHLPLPDATPPSNAAPPPSDGRAPHPSTAPPPCMDGRLAPGPRAPGAWRQDPGRQAWTGTEPGRSRGTGTEPGRSRGTAPERIGGAGAWRPVARRQGLAPGAPAPGPGAGAPAPGPHYSPTPLSPPPSLSLSPPASLSLPPPLSPSLSQSRGAAARPSLSLSRRAEAAPPPPPPSLSDSQPRTLAQPPRFPEPFAPKLQHHSLPFASNSLSPNSEDLLLRRSPAHTVKGTN
ncbi:hypothetical protein U9M48_026000 [Paspalum notatum var. saurae]|uniref:Uncharacterized protein n=1 Tax=Paspalum notatum var. saurae TaxID=547442 RepID=A0AAQ3TRZ2_PASNO